jgi:hypothetical protein
MSEYPPEYNLLVKYAYVVVPARVPAIGVFATLKRAGVPVVRARTARLSELREDAVCARDVTLRDAFVVRDDVFARDATERDAVPRETVVVGRPPVVRETVERDTVRLDVVVFERGLCRPERTTF